MEEPIVSPPSLHATTFAAQGPSWTALGLALIAVGAVTYTLIIDRAEQLGQEEMQARLSGQIQQLETKLAEQTKTSAARADELAAITQSLAQNLSRTARERALIDAQNLLELANQRLQFAYDFSGALQALHLADERLRSTSDPSLNAIRRVLAEEMVRLRALPVLDSAGLQTKLQGLTAQMDHLPIHAQRSGAAATITPPQAALHTWQDWVGAVWAQLKQLVVVRYNDKPIGPLLAPDQAVYLLQNLRIKFEEARLAVLLHDQTAYHHALASATQWLHDYFDNAAPSVAGALASVRELQAYNVQPPLPDISGSLRLLQRRAQELGLNGVNAS
ncbi:MAG: uroporphyrinogen-III C-methyltransferase [Pseudomonadota bacterium]